MAETPTISVIICVFNGADVIGEQLNALAEQSVDVPWEVVVADNRSTDSTRYVVEDIGRDFPVPLTIVDACNKQGAAYARNCAVKASRGVYLAFCDSDDRVGNGWLRASLDHLQSNDLVGGALRELREPFEPDSPVLSGAHLHMNAFGVSLPSGNFAARRVPYFQIGGFDESLPAYGMEDVDFSVRANLKHFRIAIASDMVVYFRPTRDARTLVRKSYLSAQAEYVLWSRYPDVFADTGWRADVGRTLRRVVQSARDFATTRDRRHVKSGLRSAVTFCGHVASRLDYSIGRAPTAPILLSPADDKR